jgi:hypothetical protein
MNQIHEYFNPPPPPSHKAKPTSARCFRPTVKPPLYQAPTKQSHHKLDSSFLSSFQIVWPSVISLGSQKPVRTSDYDLPHLQSHSNADTLNYNASNQKLTEK